METKASKQEYLKFPYKIVKRGEVQNKLVADDFVYSKAKGNNYKYWRCSVLTCKVPGNIDGDWFVVKKEKYNHSHERNSSSLIPKEKVRKPRPSKYKKSSIIDDFLNSKAIGREKVVKEVTNDENSIDSDELPLQRPKKRIRTEKDRTMIANALNELRAQSFTQISSELPSTQVNCVACDSIYGTIELKKSPMVTRMFEEVVGLKIQSHYTICKDCHTKIESFYYFRKKCHEIHSIYNENDESFYENEPEVNFDSKNIEVVSIKAEKESSLEVSVQRTFDSDEEFLPENIFHCSNCSQTFKDKNSQLKHEITHLYKAFECPAILCDANFSNPDDCASHLTLTHNMNENEIQQYRWKMKYNCVKCDNGKFFDFNDFLAHFKDAHENSGNRFMCDVINQILT
jgi:hypothetical protein